MIQIKYLYVEVSLNSAALQRQQMVTIGVPLNM
jgi:hypothetical protein